MDNLEEMDKFLETYNFPRLSHEEIENLKRPITSKEVESITENLSINKNQNQTSLVTFTKHLKKYLILLLLKLFPENEKRMLLNSFYEASITLIPNQTKTPQKRKLQVYILDEHRCKNPKQMLVNQIQ